MFCLLIQQCLITALESPTRHLFLSSNWQMSPYIQHIISARCFEKIVLCPLVRLLRHGLELFDLCVILRGTNLFVALCFSKRFCQNAQYSTVLYIIFEESQRITKMCNCKYTYIQSTSLLRDIITPLYLLIQLKYIMTTK